MIETLLTGSVIPSPDGNRSTAAVTLVRHPEGPVLLDPASWHQRAALVAALAVRGLQPRDIVAIAVTHLHWDHCMNFDLFPQARFLIPEAELRRIRQGHGDPATPEYLLDVIPSARIEPVREGEILAGMNVLETPGHTSGHVSYAVETDSGTVIIAGDALATRDDATKGRPALTFGDPQAAGDSVARLLKTADVLVPGHDAPFLPDVGFPRFKARLRQRG